jgi:hypothetical protein
MDKKQEQMMKEKYADMYITMLSLLNEEEMAAKPTPTPLEPVAEIDADYSITVPLRSFLTGPS